VAEWNAEENQTASFYQDEHMNSSHLLVKWCRENKKDTDL
jgi:hypothetical protein